MRSSYAYQRLDSLTDATVDAASSFFDKSQPAVRRLSKNRVLAIVLVGGLFVITWGLFSLHPSRPTDIRLQPLDDPKNPLPPAFEVERQPTGGKPPVVNEEALKAAIQDTYQRKGDPNIGCKLEPWHEARYAALKDSSKPHPSASRLQSNATTVFIAMNLYNSAPLFPVLVDQLPETIRFLGVQNVHLSIYENASDDDTGAVLILRESPMHTL